MNIRLLCEEKHILILSCFIDKIGIKSIILSFLLTEKQNCD